MFKVSTGEVFIPEYQIGADDGKPYTFHLHYLTPDEREQASQIYVPFKGTRRSVSVKTDLRSCFTLGVKLIENVSIEVDGKIIEIKTAEDFLKYPMPDELYQEVALRINKTSGIEVKN